MRAIGSLEPEILRNLSENLAAKFSGLHKNAHLDDAFSEIMNWKQSQRKANHWRKKIKKEKKEKVLL